MEKQLKDYLHLYNNRFNPVKVIVDNEEQKYLWDIEVYEEDYVNITLGDTKLRDMEGNSDNWNVYNDNYSLDRIKPILRPLSDIKSDEIIKVIDESDIITDNCYHCFRSIMKGGGTSFKIYVSITNSLRKLHFDCDGLIEAGIAIDKTTMAA